MDERERGREAYRQRAWLAAYKALFLADEATPLGAEDLELFATSAYLIGRNDDGICALDRAYHVYLDAGEPETYRCWTSGDTRDMSGASPRILGCMPSACAGCTPRHPRCSPE